MREKHEYWYSAQQPRVRQFDRLDLSQNTIYLRKTGASSLESIEKQPEYRQDSRHWFPDSSDD